MDHARKNHNLSLFARMGGPFDRLYFELFISGEDLEPQAVSKVLGVEPSKSYEKGDERPRGSQFYKTGAWILKSPKIILSDTQDGSQEFEQWVNSLPSESKDWSGIQRDYSVKVRLIGYTDQWNAEFIVSPTTLMGLAKRGLPLLIDPYLSLDEDGA